MKILKVINIASASLFLCLLSNRIGATSVPNIIRASTLEYAPYVYTVDGEAKGIAIDIIKEAFRRSSNATEVEFKFYPWKRALHSVKCGKRDLLFNAAKSKAREEWGTYTKTELISQRYVLFKKKDSDVSVNPDFSNTVTYSIGVRAGYFYGTGTFSDALESNKFFGIEYTNSTKQSVDMLLGGRIDMFVGDYLPVMRYLKENDLINLIDIVQSPTQIDQDMIILTMPNYLLFNKKNITREFVESIDKIMLEMKRDETYRKIYLSYM
ncbi:hypothetical protein MACH09_41690 [Vibrio sp. MACH09]|uniref:substrate-binding periplasmic protein n=1 Tax=Vibrio sp. MACH09 TaxID=3025122 RepID=UPI00278D6B9B|nr:transporter substrate-binding domain-containing protein [Vibrio sp. MACH09]GLO63661.1 hypothetical protein MACH09_41690 [Vibrio sp. MACH09]